MRCSVQFNVHPGRAETLGAPRFPDVHLLGFWVFSNQPTVHNGGIWKGELAGEGPVAVAVRVS